MTKGAFVNVTDKIGSFTVHSVSTNVAEYPVGTTIYMSNDSYSNVVPGTIQDLYYINVQGGIYFLHQTKVSHIAVSGDSGSPIIIPLGAVDGVVCCKLLGIESGGTSTYDVFSKYYYINSQLGVSAITN
ncbi:MAG: hypothetical protein K5927_07105 [Lachnospiraceae bacterium]|nr:hypothetical protein [Lachnospiraceae bacterium]